MRTRFFLFTLLIVVLFLGTAACGKTNKDKNTDLTEDPSSEIVGVWEAVVEKEIQSAYSYKPDRVTLHFYLSFHEDGTVENRSTGYLNDKLMQDTGWVIGNTSWRYDGNKIIFSSGKYFVVKDGEFDDIYDGAVLRYRKR